jgi:hypothetical protein
VIIPAEPILDCDVGEFAEVAEVIAIGAIWETEETEVGSGARERDACANAGWYGTDETQMRWTISS